MLIHVSKYIFVNQRIFKQVSNVLDQCRSTLNNPGDPSYKILIGDLKIFDDYKTNENDQKISFDEIFSEEDGIIQVIQDVSKNIKCLIEEATII